MGRRVCTFRAALSPWILVDLVRALVRLVDVLIDLVGRLGEFDHDAGLVAENLRDVARPHKVGLARGELLVRAVVLVPGRGASSGSARSKRNRPEARRARRGRTTRSRFETTPESRSTFMHPCSMMPKCVAGHQSGFPGMMGLQTQRQSKDGSIQSFEAFLPPISVVTCARASDLTIGSRHIAPSCSPRAA